MSVIVKNVVESWISAVNIVSQTLQAYKYNLLQLIIFEYFQTQNYNCTTVARQFLLIGNWLVLIVFIT